MYLCEQIEYNVSHTRLVETRQSESKVYNYNVLYIVPRAVINICTCIRQPSPRG